MSELPLTINFVPFIYASELTGLVCPLNVEINSPDSCFHIFIVLSPLPIAKHFKTDISAIQ